MLCSIFVITISIITTTFSFLSGIKYPGQFGPISLVFLPIHDILPGSIRSPLKEGQLSEALKNTGDTEVFNANTKELGSPDGVAKIVAFIVSDNADYLRGSIVTR